MATLHDTVQRRSLTIQPVMPNLTGPANAYDVQLSECEQIAFERQYTIYPGSPDGHWHIWRLIRAFQSASQVLDAKTNLNISASRGDEFCENAVLQVETGWLTIALHGKVNRGQHPQPYEVIHFFAEVYLLNGPQLEMAEQFVVPFIHTQLRCLPSAVKTFGDELLVECRAALKRREELGITAPADDYIDT